MRYIGFLDALQAQYSEPRGAEFSEGTDNFAVPVRVLTLRQGKGKATK